MFGFILYLLWFLKEVHFALLMIAIIVKEIDLFSFPT